MPDDHRARKRRYWDVAPPQIARFADGRGWRCPDDRCGEGALGVLVPHPADPERRPDRCPTCLTTAARRKEAST